MIPCRYGVHVRRAGVAEERAVKDDRSMELTGEGKGCRQASRASADNEGVYERHSYCGSCEVVGYGCEEVGYEVGGETVEE